MVKTLANAFSVKAFWQSLDRFRHGLGRFGHSFLPAKLRCSSLKTAVTNIVHNLLRVRLLEYYLDSSGELGPRRVAILKPAKASIKFKYNFTLTQSSPLM